MKCFETLKYLNGHFFHLDYHSFRLNRTAKELFGSKKIINLSKILNSLDRKEGLYRCKVIYTNRVEKVEFFEYIPRELKKFRFVEIDFDYKYKFLDRTTIDSLDKSDCDDLILIKNGLITDSTIANIAVFDGKEWLTPKKTLLNGTTRAKLKFLQKKDLTKKDIVNAQEMALLNALIGFRKIKNPQFLN